MNVLITGGAGFLGINLIRYLLRKNTGVIRSLDIAEFDFPEKDAIETITGDIRDAETVRKAAAGMDVVIHTAAALPLYSKEDIFSTDIVGTGNVLEQSLACGVSRIVHISSTAVYGIPDHHPIYEDDRLDGVGYYGYAKIEAEKLCEKRRERGACIPVIRPKSFIGPERLGVFAVFYEWAMDGRNFPMIGKGNNRYQLLDVEDLCEAIFLCMNKEDRLVNDTFNIGAAEFTTMKDDYQAILDEAGFGKKNHLFSRLARGYRTSFSGVPASISALQVGVRNRV